LKTLIRLARLPRANHALFTSQANALADISGLKGSKDTPQPAMRFVCPSSSSSLLTGGSTSRSVSAALCILSSTHPLSSEVIHRTHRKNRSRPANQGVQSPPSQEEGGETHQDTVLPQTRSSHNRVYRKCMRLLSILLIHSKRPCSSYPELATRKSQSSSGKLALSNKPSFAVAAACPSAGLPYPTKHWATAITTMPPSGT
jgi:hypothetical protein